MAVAAFRTSISGLLTDGAFREAVLVWPVTGKRGMAGSPATKMLADRDIALSNGRSISQPAC